MAKKEEGPKIVLERVYNVPLRKEFLKAPNWNRSKKAVTALRQFISKHMKSDDVRIGEYINLHIWKDGIKKPPHHVKVNAIKDDKGTVKVELVVLPKSAERKLLKEKEAEKKSKDKKEKKETTEKKDEKIEDKVESKDEKTEKTKQIEKEELKELKKELPKQEAPKVMPQPKQTPQVRPTAPKSQ